MINWRGKPAEHISQRGEAFLPIIIFKPFVCEHFKDAFDDESTKVSPGTGKFHYEV
jgi:hypothetical protein